MGTPTRETQLRLDHDRRMRAGAEERDSFTSSITQVHYWTKPTTVLSAVELHYWLNCISLICKAALKQCVIVWSNIKVNVTSHGLLLETGSDLLYKSSIHCTVQVHQLYEYINWPTVRVHQLYKSNQFKSSSHVKLMWKWIDSIPSVKLVEPV